MENTLKFILTGIIFCAASFTSAALSEGPAEEAAEPVGISPTMEIAPGIVLGVLTEVSASYERAGGENASDINFDTFELGLTAELREGITFEGVLLYEEGDDLCIDSAFFELAVPSVDGLSFEAGLLYLPFGVFNTLMISDPMTLELGEVSAASAGFSYSFGPFGISGHVFAGELDDSDDIDNFVASFSFAPADGIELGAAVISDIGECGYCDDINDALAEGDYDSSAGIDIWAASEFGALAIYAEYLAAVEDMTIADSRFKPQTWSIDACYQITADNTVGLRYEGSREFRSDEFPEHRFGVCVEHEFNDYFTIAAEYMYGKFDSGEDSDLDDSHTATVRFAFSF